MEERNSVCFALPDFFKKTQTRTKPERSWRPQTAGPVMEARRLFKAAPTSQLNETENEETKPAKQSDKKQRQRKPKRNRNDKLTKRETNDEPRTSNRTETEHSSLATR